MKGLAAKALFPCPKIVEFVYDYAEGNLSRMTAYRFDLHISFCKGCREYVLLYKSAADGSEFRKLNPPPEELVEKTFAFLHSHGMLESDASAGSTSKP